MADSITFLNLAQFFEGSLGVNTPVAWSITVVFLFMLIMIPMILLKVHQTILALGSILMLAVVTGIGWLPNFVWIMLGVYVAILMAQRLRGWF